MFSHFIKKESGTFGSIVQFTLATMKNWVVLFSLLFVCVNLNGVQAQLSAIHHDPDAQFKSAKELFQKEQYSLAFPVFKSLVMHNPNNSQIPGLISEECRYYYILCGLLLFDPTVEAAAENFIQFENNTARIAMLQFHLGEYYFNQHNFSGALSVYEKTATDNLSPSEVASMKFHQGYGYFVIQQFTKAKPLFDAVRQIKTDPNYIDANYYFGFICFNEKNYNQALECFQIAEKSPEYSNLVPFYLSEIYYFKGDRDQALQKAESALQSANQFYDLQLNQLVGHILYEKKLFGRALPFLEKFVNGKEKVNRETLYELSYCYYEAGNWPKTIEGFKQLSGGTDSLAQNSMYLLADAYLKVNDKINARTAFQFCAANNSNAIQQEVSAFNVGKLSYDLGYMDKALEAFESFIKKYPSSIYVQEARELLVNTLANSSNYKKALQLYDSLPIKSDGVIRLYPRLLYGNVVELINDQLFDKADILLNILLQAPYHNGQLPFANFWKGEIAYRKGNSDSTIYFMQFYLKQPLVNGEVNPINAKYSLAYAYLKTEAYGLAKEYFGQIVSKISARSNNIELDAYTRMADCYFMEKSFQQALDRYEAILQLHIAFADYALYQKAIIMGALNKTNEKIALLISLDKTYPASRWAMDANMALADTYLANENYQSALLPLNKLLDQPNAKAYAANALLKLGVAYFNLDKNDIALQQFKKLVAGFPNAVESNDAIDYIRNIFIEKQQPDAFVSFMKEQGKPIAFIEQDSLTYRSAYLRYEANDLKGALNGFVSYLLNFPDGKYSLEANYLSAEILTAYKLLLKALPYYQLVADKGQSKYAERSLLQTARIYYFEQKNYETAEKYFLLLKNMAVQQENKLEAMRGLLRCQFSAKNWKEALPNALELLTQNGIAGDDRMMAGLVLANNKQLNGEDDGAIAAYKLVMNAGKSAFAAEAQYHIAEILLKQQKLTEAEKAGFEVIKKYGSYEYWVTKSYILLGDVYTQQKDWFNAEATFKSIIENAVFPELKTEAQEKLQKVLGEKNKANKIDQQ